ncbi:MAG: cobalt-precorrin-6A reductase [Rhodospirillaceae bacterium]|nr:cobalt-precorrin-6A reductase [Rhodospirillaceae bacterium]
MSKEKRLLILGGTGEAVELADRLVSLYPGRLHVISSLAGRIGTPREIPGTVRVGGFGGGPGLADYIKSESIDLLIDATHPFAANISTNAYDACLATEIPRLALRRPPWRMPPSARWVEVPDMAAAAEVLPSMSKRAFLTIGRSGLDAFAHVEGIHFLVRMIEAPDGPLPLKDYTLITGRPPFTDEAEVGLLEGHRIDTLVSKQSGGAATVAKLGAAVALNLRILLIARPLPEPGETAETVEAALSWMKKRL